MGLEHRVLSRASHGLLKASGYSWAGAEGVGVHATLGLSALGSRPNSFSLWGFDGTWLLSSGRSLGTQTRWNQHTQCKCLSWESMVETPVVVQGNVGLGR